MNRFSLGLCALLSSTLAIPAGAQKAIDMVPASAQVVVSVPNLGKTVDNARTVVETFCASPTLSGLLQEGLGEMSKELGFNPLQRNTWKALGIDTGRDAAFFFTFAADQDGKTEPVGGLILPINDFGTIKDTIRNLISNNGRRKFEWRAEEGLPGALRAYRESWNGESMRPVGDVLFAERSGYLLAGFGDRGFEAKGLAMALNCQEGVGADPRWSAGCVRLGGQDTDIFAAVDACGLIDQIYLGLEAEAEAAAKEAEESKEEWRTSYAEARMQGVRQLEWVRSLLQDFAGEAMMSLALSENGVRMSAMMEGNQDMAALYAPQSPPRGLSALIPDNPLALLHYSINLSAMDKMFSGIPDDVKKEMDLDKIDDALEMGNAMLGIDLVEDVWKQLSGRFQLAIGAPSETLEKMILDAIANEDIDPGTAMRMASLADLNLAVEFKDSSGVVSMVENLVTMATENAPFKVETKEVPKGKLWILGPENNGEMMPLGAVAIVNDILMVGTARSIQGAVARLASGAAPQVADQRVQKTISSGSGTALYIDIKPIHRFAKALSRTVQQEEMTIFTACLASLDSLVMVGDYEGKTAYSFLELRFK